MSKTDNKPPAIETKEQPAVTHSVVDPAVIAGTVAPKPEEMWLSVAKLRKALEGLPDEAVVVVDDGQTIVRPVRTAEPFRGRKIDHRKGDAIRLGTGGDLRLLVMAVAR